MDISKRWVLPSVSSSGHTSLAVLLCWIFLCLVESKADVRECYCSSCSFSARVLDAPPTCLTNGSCYTHIDELHSGAVKVRQGCLSQSDSKRMCQSSEGLPSLSCCSENLCNKLPSLLPRQRKLLSDNTQSSSTPDGHISNNVLTLTVGVCVAAAVVLAGLLIATAITLFICYVCYYSKGRGGHCPQHSNGDVEAATGKRCSAIVPHHETLSGMLTQLSPQSPSLSLLIQEDVVSKVVLLGMLRKGTFSSYHEGRWREEKVCVRVYPELHEQMFYSESNLYQTLHMRHENIVAFIAAQSHKRSSTNLSFQYLITVHYERGFLADHLAASTLDIHSTLLLAKSAAAGLAHLHREVLGEGGRVEKDGIVHRNVTSRAFWIKADGSCCLGDFSLAVKNDADFRSHLKCKPNGHTHYLSPELLGRGATSTQEGVSFEELKKSDVYAFSLVMWEIARRCVIHGAVEAAELPYAHMSCGETCYQGACAQIATSDQMKETVFTRKLRPPLAEQWSLDDTMQSYVFLFVESWSDELDKRPSIVSLKNSLDKLHSRCSLIREETNSSSKSCSQHE